MSIPVPITKPELRSLRKVLAKDEVVVCLDEVSFIKATLVAMDMLSSGREVKAEIKPPKERK
jgi:hypothetical protein